MNKTTIIELCMSPDLGGLELYMVQTAKKLSQEFHVVSVIKKGSKLESYFQESPDVVKINKNSKLLMFRAAKELASLIDTMDVDVLHMHWGKDTPFAVLAKLLSKKRPKLVQSRHMTMTRFKNSFYHRMLYRQIDLILPVTKQVQEQLQKFIPSDIRPKIKQHYPGIEKKKLFSYEELVAYKKELGFKEKSFNIGMVGRINEAKGQHLLIRSLKKIEDKQLHLYFVGHEMQDGYIEKLKSIAKSIGVESRVHFLGFLENPHQFYQTCDAIVLASKRETFGLVLAEAMSMGIAVIGSNSGGVVEIIDDNIDGLLFDSRDHNHLSEKIKLLIYDDTLRFKLRKNGLNKVSEKFNSDKQFEELQTILKSTLSL